MSASRPPLHPLVAAAQRELADDRFARPPAPVSWQPAPDVPTAAVPPHAGKAGAVLPVLLVVVGLVVAGFAGWELGLSDVYGRWQQQRLAGQLQQGPSGDPLALVVSERGDVLDPALDATWNRANEPPPGLSSGDPMATLSFPSLGQSHTMVVGATLSELTAGPGWMVGSALPGMPGNAVVAGHRTTYGAPFHDLHLLGKGDRVVVERPGRPTATFEVRDVFTVAPDEGEVTAPTDGVRLTLFACHPIGSAAQRIVVQAELVDGAFVNEALSEGRWRPYGDGETSLL